MRGGDGQAVTFLSAAHGDDAGQRLQFLFRHRPAVLPVWHEGRLQLVRWGNRRGESKTLPLTGWTWKATSQTLLSGGLLAEKTLTEKCGGSLCSGTTVLRVYIDPIAAF